MSLTPLLEPMHTIYLYICILFPLPAVHSSLRAMRVNCRPMLNLNDYNDVSYALLVCIHINDNCAAVTCGNLIDINETIICTCIINSDTSKRLVLTVFVLKM